MARFEKRRFHGKFGGGPSIPRPVKEGEEYDVEIKEVGSRGDGIARVKNFVVFVPNTKKGEKAHIKIKQVRNRFAIGEKTTGEAKEELGAEEAPEEEMTEEIAEEAPEEELAEEETEEE